MKLLRWERAMRKLNLVFAFLVFVFLVNCYFYFQQSTNSVSVVFRPLQRPTNTHSPFNLSALPANDYRSLLNLKDFRFVLNNNRCNKSANGGFDDSVFLIIFIHSAPNNFKKRLAIRETWGNESNFVNDKIRVIFTLGIVFDPSVQQSIERENAEYKDIVQGNFVDSYRNLSYKHVMGLKWVTYYCQNTKFVFKTDDDIFVDIFQLMFYLKGWLSEVFPLRNFMSCYVISNPYPKRSVRSKWHVTYEEYPGKYYPEYCSGWGILMSPDVVFRLYAHSREVSYFWVDDVMISGLLAQRIGVRHIDLTSKLAIEDDDVTGWLKKDELSIPPLFGHPDTDTDTIYALWNKSIKYYRTKYERL
ncbi:Beta-1:3-galactosyltransferase 1-like protein [Dinothrombium tinctorium]|uniref:Hexosyltransferase n=1 Tax=Dinothrombium tinctorium TaxID=1965070 RepID=A0A443RK74_9ACAR|nr:Beta-1:3-galactosyltransferase 1-like protein [Dinothrombium tinctorium]